MRPSLTGILLLSTPLWLGCLTARAEGPAGPASNNLPPAIARARAPVKLPKARVVQSPGASADSAIESMYFSENVPTSVKDPRFKMGQNLVQLETDWIKAVLDGKFPGLEGVPLQDVMTVEVRYGCCSEGVTGELIDAFKRSNVEVYSDGPRFYRTGSLPKGTKFSYDFSEAKLMTQGEPGTALKRMLDAGMRMDEQIFLSPLWNGADFNPLMHEKKLFFLKRVNGQWEPVFMALSTANLNEKVGRANRTLTTRDRDLMRESYAQVEDLKKTFKAKLHPRERPFREPLEIRYRDGSSITTGFTANSSAHDFNPNDQAVKVQQDAAKAPGSLKEYLGSQNSMTRLSDVESLSAWLKADPDAKITILIDAEFGGMRTPGIAAAIASFGTYPEGRPKIRGIPRSLVYDSKGEPRVQVMVYERPMPGIEVTDLLQDYNQKYLWHDKTKHLIAVRNGDVRALISTGTLNNSNATRNMEENWFLDLPADSPVSRHIQDTVRGTIASQKDWVYPVEEYLLKDSVAILTHRSPLEIPREQLARLVELARQSRTRDFVRELRRIAAQPTTLMNKLDAEVVEHRIGRLETFLGWVEKQPSNSVALRRLRPSQMADVVLFASDPSIRVRDAAWSIGSFLDPKRYPEPELQARIAEGVEMLGLDAKPMDKQAPPSFARRTLELPPAHPGEMKVFDIDGTLMNLPSRNYLYKKGTDEEVAISAEEFRDARKELGKPGTRWEDYEIRDTLEGTFRDATNGKNNNFLRAIQEAVQGRPESWQGPQWNEFAEVLNDTSGGCLRASTTGIITARRHTSRAILEGLVFLQKKGFIKCLPKPENIRAVMGEEFNPGFKIGVEEAKQMAMEQDLDLLQGASSRAGRKTVYYFTDDDPANIAHLREWLAQNPSRWPDVEIQLRHAVAGGRGPLYRFNEHPATEARLPAAPQACPPGVSQRLSLQNLLPPAP